MGQASATTVPCGAMSRKRLKVGAVSEWGGPLDVSDAGDSDSDEQKAAVLEVEEPFLPDMPHAAAASSAAASSSVAASGLYIADDSQGFGELQSFFPVDASVLGILTGGAKESPGIFAGGATVYHTGDRKTQELVGLEDRAMADLLCWKCNAWT